MGIGVGVGVAVAVAAEVVVVSVKGVGMVVVCRGWWWVLEGCAKTLALFFCYKPSSYHVFPFTSAKDGPRKVLP